MYAALCGTATTNDEKTLIAILRQSDDSDPQNQLFYIKTASCKYILRNVVDSMDITLY